MDLDLGPGLDLDLDLDLDLALALGITASTASSSTAATAASSATATATATGGTSSSDSGGASSSQDEPLLLGDVSPRGAGASMLSLFAVPSGAPASSSSSASRHAPPHTQSQGQGHPQGYTVGVETGSLSLLQVLPGAAGRMDVAMGGEGGVEGLADAAGRPAAGTRPPEGGRDEFATYHTSYGMERKNKQELLRSLCASILEHAEELVQDDWRLDPYTRVAPLHHLI